MHKTINLAGLDPYAGACEEKIIDILRDIFHLYKSYKFSCIVFGTNRKYMFKIEH